MSLLHNEYLVKKRNWSQKRIWLLYTETVQLQAEISISYCNNGILVGLYEYVYIQKNYFSHWPTECLNLLSVCDCDIWVTVTAFIDSKLFSPNSKRVKS